MKAKLGQVVSGIKLFCAGMSIVKDPQSLDKVIELADELQNPKIFEPIERALKKDPEVAQSFVKRDRVENLDLVEMRNLPKGSLGKVFSQFLDANHLDPNDLPKRPAITDHDFIAAHLFETHDIWHVVTGFETDVAGELGLQAFYIAQFPSMLGISILALGLFNTVFFGREDYKRRMEAIVHGWTMGKQAKPLFGVSWKNLWLTPIDEVQRNFNLGPRFIVA